MPIDPEARRLLLAQLDAGRLGLMLITAAIAGANWLWA